MQRVPLVFMILIILLSSCMTYTHEEAKLRIEAESSVPEIPLPSTKKPLEKIGKPVDVPSEIPSFSAALVPVPCQRTPDMIEAIVKETIASGIDIIGFTGQEAALAAIAKALPMPVFWFEDGGMLATRFPMRIADPPFITIEMNGNTTILVSLLDLEASNQYEELHAAPQEKWPDVVDAASASKLETLAPVLDFTGNGPIVVLASLGEPSGEDWFETAEDHPYRTGIRWTLVEALGEQGYLDSWRSTHHDAVTHPGTTWEFADLGQSFSERIDYLFTKGLLPLETQTITITSVDTNTFPYELRSAVTGTFVIT